MSNSVGLVISLKSDNEIRPNETFRSIFCNVSKYQACMIVLCLVKIFSSVLFSTSLSLTSRLVKTLLYNFIRQEKCPPPATHIFEPKDEGGLLYGLASGVASKRKHIHSQTETKDTKPRSYFWQHLFTNLLVFCSWDAGRQIPRFSQVFYFSVSFVEGKNHMEY